MSTTVSSVPMHKQPYPLSKTAIEIGRIKSYLLVLKEDFKIPIDYSRIPSTNCTYEEYFENIADQFKIIMDEIQKRREGY